MLLDKLEKAEFFLNIDMKIWLKISLVKQINNLFEMLQLVWSLTLLFFYRWPWRRGKN